MRCGGLRIRVGPDRKLKARSPEMSQKHLGFQVIAHRLSTVRNAEALPGFRYDFRSLFSSLSRGVADVTNSDGARAGLWQGVAISSGKSRACEV